MVENSRNVFVTVFGPTGNQRYPAEVVQPDAARDLVLLKIKATQSLPVAPSVIAMNSWWVSPSLP
ncbi:hypothetical protein CCP3SC1_450037 [Gammaproteobacteria bacterium]